MWLRDPEKARVGATLEVGRSYTCTQHAPTTQHELWGGAGAPGGTVRRAAVRKRGPGSASLS